MLLSRGSRLLQCVIKRNAIINRQAGEVAHKKSWFDWDGPWMYREPSKPIPQALFLAELLGGLGWYWILWHCRHDYHHLVGYDIPDPDNWTDSQLGIPPDDADC